MNTVVIGPKDCGKTQLLKNLVFCLLQAKTRQKKVGFTILETSRDFFSMIQRMAAYFRIDLMVLHPQTVGKQESAKYNILAGKNAAVVAEVLGDALSQTYLGSESPEDREELVTYFRLAIRVMKHSFGDELSFQGLTNYIREMNAIRPYVETYAAQSELLAFTTPMERDFLERIRQVPTDESLATLIEKLSAYLDDIANNPEFAPFFQTNEVDVDLQEHVWDGGVLYIKTVPDTKIGKFFGLSISRLLQETIQRRHVYDRVPHYVFIDGIEPYVDSHMEVFLKEAGNHNCSCIFTLSTLQKAMYASLVKHCQNKIGFKGMSEKDSKRVVELSGGQWTYDEWEQLNRILPPYWYAHSITVNGQEKQNLGITRVKPIDPYNPKSCMDRRGSDTYNLILSAVM